MRRPQANVTPIVASAAARTPAPPHVWRSRCRCRAISTSSRIGRAIRRSSQPCSRSSRRLAFRVTHLRLPAADRLQTGRPSRTARSLRAGLRRRGGAGDRQQCVPSGDVVIPGRLRYQACDDKICYQPTTAPVEWTLRVVPQPEGNQAGEHAAVFGAPSPRRGVSYGSARGAGAAATRRRAVSLR